MTLKKDDLNPIKDTQTYAVSEQQETPTVNTDSNGVNKCVVGELKKIAVANLKFNKDIHPRENPAEDLDQLKDSIERNGILEPLIVQESTDEPGSFILLAGSRRAEVLRQTGHDEALCIVQEPREDAEAAHQAFEANRHRKSYSPIEEAKHYSRMQVKYGYTLEEIGKKYNITKTAVSQKMSVLNLPNSIQKMISAKTITPAHGRLFLKLDTQKEQEDMAKLVTEKKLSVSQTKTKVYRHKRNKKRKSEHKIDDANIPDIEIPNVHFKSSEDMSQEIDDGQIHMIATSTPWAVGKEFEKGSTPMSIFDDIKPVLDECARVLCSGGVLAINLPMLSKEKTEDVEKGRIHPENFLPSAMYCKYLKKLGLYLTTSVVWWKKNLNNHNFSPYIPISKVKHACYRFVPQAELILIFRKKGKREGLPSKEIQERSHLTDAEFLEWGKDIWLINKVANDGHPCTWPDELPERLIRMFSYEGDVVLDPFLGSGTTVKVALDLDRVGIGYEREVKYKPVIMKKLGLLPVTESVAETSNTMMDYLNNQRKNTLIFKSSLAAAAAPPPQRDADVLLEATMGESLSHPV